MKDERQNTPKTKKDLIKEYLRNPVQKSIALNDMYILNNVSHNPVYAYNPVWGIFHVQNVGDFVKRGDVLICKYDFYYDENWGYEDKFVMLENVTLKTMTEGFYKQEIAEIKQKLNNDDSSAVLDKFLNKPRFTQSMLRTFWKNKQDQNQK